MLNRQLFYSISDTAWTALCDLLGCKQAPPRPTLVYNDQDAYGWHLETPTPEHRTPGISKAINQIPLAIPDHTQWLDYRPEPYRKHDNFYIGKFGATTFDTSDEYKRKRGLILFDSTRTYLLNIALHLKVKSNTLRTTQTGLCSAVLEAIGLGSIRPDLPPAAQAQDLATLIKDIKLPVPDERTITRRSHMTMTPQELARQALINAGVDPEELEKYGVLHNTPLTRNT